jgi:hypothetical protein
MTSLVTRMSRKPISALIFRAAYEAGKPIPTEQFMNDS